ncbi:hypothetical protein [Psychrobacillus lasiicapitis]|uniref:Uncharacterized protein n=1 Tax=Psychrobacillus lasiicapitis TaxID=1636719 RepID=A0A544TAH5_9BACI|nr:hypothetical protein [Psychrobacillus lasiicapitis]TQR14386.1 hypothetical protein FG382_07975 [Psychrobacillus lasiicapitis]GGA31787.1 hypothetical protein GCM10011384_21670 [Psychrobacillus lasiicapitis]
MLVLVQLILVGLLVLFCLTFKKKAQKVTLINPEQFISSEPILPDLPKRAVRNTHWFTHTFMRPRRKG